MSSFHNRYDTVVVTKDGPVSINLKNTLERLHKLIEDHHGCQVINMQNFTKDQVEHFMQQLYKTDEDVSDKHEVDETTLTADSQDININMDISDDSVNRPTLSLDVPTFGPAVSPPLSESSLIDDGNIEPEDVSMLTDEQEVSMDLEPDQFFCSDCGNTI